MTVPIRTRVTAFSHFTMSPFMTGVMICGAALLVGACAKVKQVGAGGSGGTGGSNPTPMPGIPNLASLTVNPRT